MKDNYLIVFKDSTIIVSENKPEKKCYVGGTKFFKTNVSVTLEDAREFVYNHRCLLFRCPERLKTMFVECA